MYLAFKEGILIINEARISELRTQLQDYLPSDVEEIFPDFSQPKPNGAPHVVKIIDGDSLLVAINERNQEVRLAGIDAPEYNQPWGKRASEALRKMVGGKEISVTVLDVDQYDRLVSDIYLESSHINRALVAEGHACVYRDFLTDRTLLADERRARRNELGLWQHDDPMPPWEWRRR